MDASLIAVFKVYHQGALYGSTFLTSHTVAGLAPCQHYEAKVEAVCGESIVMNVRALQTHTGVYRCAGGVVLSPTTIILQGGDIRCLKSKTYLL